MLTAPLVLDQGAPTVWPVKPPTTWLPLEAEPAQLVTLAVLQDIVLWGMTRTSVQAVSVQERLRHQRWHLSIPAPVSIALNIYLSWNNTFYLWLFHSIYFILFQISACHSSCGTCTIANDASKCLTCSDINKRPQAMLPGPCIGRFLKHQQPLHINI